MYQFTLKTYQRFLHFLKKPDDRSFARLGLSFKLKTLFSLLLLNVVLASIWMVGFHLLGGTHLENLNVVFGRMPYWTTVLLGVVLGPFLEEFIFRFPMKYSRNYLLQCLIAMVALFAPTESKSDIYTNARKLWKRFFWVFFYLITSVFAFAHIYNYMDARHLLLWSPLLTMVQFIGGLIMGYIRVRFGFLWGWYYHAIYNLLFFSLAFLPSGQKQIYYKHYHPKPVSTYALTIGNPKMKTYQFDCADYKLSIKKSSAKKTTYTGYYGVTPSRIYFEQCKVELIMKTLSPDRITIIDPDSLKFDIELMVKHPEKNPEQGRGILIRELTKTLLLNKKIN